MYRTEQFVSPGLDAFTVKIILLILLGRIEYEMRPIAIDHPGVCLSVGYAEKSANTAEQIDVL